MPISYLKRFIVVAIFSGITASAFAEDAPVYDVDSYPPQFDGQPTPKAPAAQTSGAPSTQPIAPVDSQGAGTPPSTASQTVEQRIQQNNNTLNTDLSARVNDLQTAVQTLRGQVEDLTHQLQQLQTQQKTMFSDLDKRISNRSGSSTPAATDTADPGIADTGIDAPALKAKKNKAKAAVPAEADAEAADQAVANDLTAATATKTEDQPNVAEEQQIYQNAYSLIKAKKYNEAATTLQKMLQKYPSGQFAANAHYWLGELYGLMGKNEQAITEFGNVVKNYPDSPKLADAQLKLGLIYAAQFKWTDAKSSFKKVINHYPGTSSAHLAAEQLKQIKQAGH